MKASVEKGRHTARVLKMWTSSIGDSRDDISRHSKTIARAAHRHLAARSSKMRRKRRGIKASFRAGKRPSSVGLAAQMRKAMANPNRSKLTSAIEADERLIGGVETGKHGRGAETRVLAAAAAEVAGKKLGRCRMRIIEDASAKPLRQFVSGNADTGSAAIADGWNGCSGIESLGYSRQMRVQARQADEETKMPRLRAIISLVKRRLSGTHQGAAEPKHLQAYLDEHAFRFNRRHSSKRGLSFYRLLENAMQISPTTYRQIVDKPKP
jgi:hypothetical protein